MADRKHTAESEVPPAEGRQALVEALLSELDAYRRELTAPPWNSHVLLGADMMADHIREWLREPQGS